MTRLLVVGMLLPLAAASAQPSVWVLSSPAGPSASLRATRALTAYDAGAAASLWAAEGVVPLSPRARVTIEVPFGFASPAFYLIDGDGNEAGEARGLQAMLGNVGVAAHAGLAPEWTVGAGLRLPTAMRTSGNGALFVPALGYLTEPGRGSAYSTFSSTATLFGSVTYERPVHGPVSVRALAIPTLVRSSGLGDFGPQTDTHVSFAAHGLVDVGRGRVGGGVGGTLPTSGSSFGLSPDVSLGGMAEFQFGRARPSMLVTVPISGIRPPTDAVVGVGVRVALD